MEARVFVWGRAEYDRESPFLLRDFTENVKIPGLERVVLVKGYDLQFDESAVSPELLRDFGAQVLCDRVLEQFHFCAGPEALEFPFSRLPLPLEGRPAEYLCFESLPGQFDPRAEAVRETFQIFTAAAGLELQAAQSFWIYALGGPLSGASLEAVRGYLDNPLEWRVKDPGRFCFQPEADSPPKPLEPLCPVPESELAGWSGRASLRLEADPLRFIQRHFRDLGREPSLTEIRILEAYWSDHCRHTTFRTSLEWDWSGAPEALSAVRSAYGLYRDLRLGAGPETLMDIATLGARFLRSQNRLEGVEESEEVNACSIFFSAEKRDGTMERCLLMFKNETHNHPTEIEPYGGAATCLGGAIRDPLSGRSYVYQGMRLSGAGARRQELSAVRPGKLPQQKICADAAHGFSDYGNRIGLATTKVREFYHPGFEAKRFECGAVLGAVPLKQVRRLKPVPGDWIVLVGGETGRDGIGGASGSSVAHQTDTVENSAVEVQRGNPIIERKLQRLFRRAEVSVLIKRSNDFGAGGVAVALGELADGLEVDLSKVPLKTAGLRPDEIAVSESQERMAVVVSADDLETFCAAAARENLSAVGVGRVIEAEEFRLLYRGEVAARFSRSFLESAGPERTAEVRISDTFLRPMSGYRASGTGFPGTFSQGAWESAFCSVLSRLDVASQRPLQQQFDSNIGAGTVLQPYGSRYIEPDSLELRTYGESQVSAQLIPLGFPLDGERAEQSGIGSDWEQSLSASLMAYGCDPLLSAHNPFWASQAAVIQAVGKLLTAGGRLPEIYLSLQEFFPRLDTPELWGEAGAAMLGALQVQHELGLAAIGGKDSVSGSFEELRVPALVSCFAVTGMPARQVFSQHMGAGVRYLYLLRPAGRPGGDSERPGQKLDYAALRASWEWLETLQKRGIVESVRSVGPEGILPAVLLFAFGGYPYRIGLRAEPLSDRPDFWQPYGGEHFWAALAAVNEAPPAALLRELDPAVEFSLLAELEPCALGSETLICREGGMEFPVACGASSNVYRAWDSTFRSAETGYPEEESRAPSPEGRELLRCSAGSEARPISAPNVLFKRLRVVIPVFPGTNSEDDLVRAFVRAGRHAGASGLEVQTPLFYNRLVGDAGQSLRELAAAIADAQILALPGGFSASDEPGGSAKYIAAVLRHPEVAAAVDGLLERKGLIFGVCNGFQALIKAGLLPYGRDWARGASYGSKTLGIALNHQKRHLASMELTRTCTNSSVWLKGMYGRDFLLPVSHAEGRLVMSPDVFAELKEADQIASVYHENINGSFGGVEALCSADGLILGRMAHAERVGIPGEGLLSRNMFSGSKGLGEKRNKMIALEQDIFQNGIQYFV